MNPAPESSTTHVEALYSQPVTRADAGASRLETPACEVCGTCSAVPIYMLPGTRFAIVRCADCGLGSLFPLPSSTEVGSFYHPDYYGSGGRKFSGLIELLVRLVGQRHARFLTKQVPAQGRVLDVGCGRGVTLQAIARTGLECHGFDVNPHAVQGLDAGIHVHVADSLADACLEDQSFDEVIIWHVLEHVPDPRAMLQEVHRILRPGGVLVVAVPNAASWQAKWAGPAWFHLDPPRHLYHFPLPALKRLLTSTGFQCQTEHHFSLRQNPFGWIQSALNRLSWLPRNGLYTILHCRSDKSRTAPQELTWQKRVQLWCLFLLLTPMALFLSIVSAICKSGATIHVVAQRNPERPSSSDSG